MFVEIVFFFVLLVGFIIISIMVSNLEIVLLKILGIRFLRIVRVFFIIVFVILLFVFFVNNFIYIKLLVKINFYRRGEIDEILKLFIIKENVFFINNIEGYLYLMGKINREIGFVENIEVVKFNIEIFKLKEIIIVKSVKFDIEENKWIFSNVNIYNVEIKEIIVKIEYKFNLYKDDLSNFIKVLVEDFRMLIIKELKKIIKE